MSLNTTFPDTEEDIKKDRAEKLEPFLVLLKEGNPKKARTLADSLLLEGLDRSSINSFAHNFMKTLCRNNLHYAKEIVSHFNEYPYNWHYWLPKESQLTLKNPEPTTSYG